MSHTRTQLEMRAMPGVAHFPASSSLLQRKCECGEHKGAGGACGACSRKKGELQRQAVRGHQDSLAPPIVHEVLDSPGQRLDPATSAFMGSRFAHDFSRVRVHTGARADASARAIGALAYTVGGDVVFAAGQYAPETSAGRRVLAHELTHVVQQSESSASGVQALAVGDPSSALEHEADAIAARVGEGGAAAQVSHKLAGGALSRTAGPVVQRLGPAGAAAGGAAVGAAVGIISFELALEHARNLATQFPGWLGVLPNCPCRESDVQADTTTWGRDANPILSWFHPGAASSYRSNATYASIQGSAHGQQCTYDASGNLITEGPGAGTPDSWSPVTHGAAHFTSDVVPWQILGWRIYSRYWRPNNGNGCPANRGENTFGRRFSEFMP